MIVLLDCDSLIWMDSAIQQVKQIQQDKKLEVLVDRELRSNYDCIEVGEILQVALLCTQYLPAHRPKMSEVVRMLEGDGLAEKWMAAHKHIGPALNFSLINCANRSLLKRHRDSDHHDGSSMVVGDGDDDDGGRSLDSYAMELSGPR